ncbi:MAG: lysophospholipid acyltransferase family protein [Bacteroidales bacterium]
MNKVLFFILYTPFYLLSLLPLQVLYNFTRFVEIIIFKLFGYRKKVILINLAGAFPTLFYPKLVALYREFTLNFSQIIAENIKLISLPAVKIARMGKIENPELLRNHYNNGRAVIIVGGHIGNWELLTKIHHLEGGEELGYSSSNLTFIYKEQHSRVSDYIVKKIRTTNSNIKLVPSPSAARTILQERESKQCFFLFADQSPPEGSKFKFNFLNRPTSFFAGPEALARSAGMAVLFLNMRRVEKEKYIVKFEEITSNPTACEKGYITEQYARLLEEAIEGQPSNWLWSHKRWKRL